MNLGNRQQNQSRQHLRTTPDLDGDGEKQSYNPLEKNSRMAQKLKSIITQQKQDSLRNNNDNRFGH